ncbi:hypothetical protein BC628DRAFT_1142795 [Trametes gibbosa]|nr:hypothetical protein BC628DRAFT_1142795 [Trametes gibbosa]
MSLRTKRSPSPLPPHLDNIRKIRLTAKGKKSDKSQGLPATTSSTSTSPQHGQEVISFSPFLPQFTQRENINDLILQTTARLAQEGKRLTRAPQLLPDGIAFDWVADLTTQGKSLKDLLSVQGIRSADLDKVLSRALPRTSHASTLQRLTPRDNITLPLNVKALQLPSFLLGDASNPIVVDEDDEETEITTTSLCTSKVASSSSHVQITQTPARVPPSFNNVSVASTSPLAGPSKQALGVPYPTQASVASPSRLSPYDSDASRRPRSRAGAKREPTHPVNYI